MRHWVLVPWCLLSACSFDYGRLRAGSSADANLDTSNTGADVPAPNPGADAGIAMVDVGTISSPDAGPEVAPVCKGAHETPAPDGLCCRVPPGATCCVCATPQGDTCCSNLGCKGEPCRPPDAASPPDLAPVPDSAPAVCNSAASCAGGALLAAASSNGACSGPNAAGGLPPTPNVPGAGGACVNGRLFSTGGYYTEGKPCPFDVVLIAPPQFLTSPAMEALWTATESAPSATSWATSYAVWRSTPSTRYCCDGSGAVRKLACN